MTKGVGIDIVDVQRMAERIEKPEFVNLVFTKAEVNYCQSKKHQAQHFAARFAAKEAYMKAIGLGWTSNADFKEIETVNDQNGKPKIILSNQTLTYFRDHSFKQALVSLSHTSTLATAIVILE